MHETFSFVDSYLSDSKSHINSEVDGLAATFQPFSINEPDSRQFVPNRTCMQIPEDITALLDARDNGKPIAIVADLSWPFFPFELENPKCRYAVLGYFYIVDYFVSYCSLNISQKSSLSMFCFCFRKASPKSPTIKRVDKSDPEQRGKDHGPLNYIGLPRILSTFLYHGLWTALHIP